MNAEANQTREYRVEGMSCANCERHVREAVEALVGVTDAAADSGQSRLRVSGPDLDDRAIAAAIDGAGYEVVGS